MFSVKVSIFSKANTIRATLGSLPFSGYVVYLFRTRLHHYRLGEDKSLKNSSTNTPP